MPTSTSKTQALVSLEALASKKYFAAWLGNREILALQTQDGVRVYSGMCPHQGGPLAEGQLTSTTLTCPWHGCKFDLKNGNCVDYGACINISNMRLASIPFEIKEGTIYVQLGD